VSRSHAEERLEIKGEVLGKKAYVKGDLSPLRKKGAPGTAGVPHAEGRE